MECKNPLFTYFKYLVELLAVLEFFVAGIEFK